MPIRSILIHAMLQDPSPTFCRPLTMLCVPQATLTSLMNRHAVLRTYYAVDETGVLQVILPKGSFLCPIEECYTEHEWSTHASRLLARPFELTKTPPIRALLKHRCPRAPPRLLVVLHHAASDFSSNLLFRDEIHQSFTALWHGREPELPALPVQYADFAVWQRRNAPAESDLLSWWKAKLSGAPQVLDLPLDQSRPEVQNGAAAACDVHIESSVGAAMMQLCRGEAVGPLCGVLAAWSILMLRLSGQDEIVLGLPKSEQGDHMETRRLIGCFVTTLPLRIPVDFGSCSYRQLLHACQGELMSAIAHSAVPFYRIVQVRSRRVRSCVCVCVRVRVHVRVRACACVCVRVRAWGACVCACGLFASV